KGLILWRDRCRTGVFEMCAGLIPGLARVFQGANIIFERYDLRNDLAESQIALANALIRLHRYERAERLCEESRDLKRGQPLGESMAFGLLAILGLKRNGTDEASNYAMNAVELADESGFDDAKADARIALGQVRLAEREFKQAVDTLLEAAEIARKRDSRLNPRWADHPPVSILSRRLELEATIYLAEAYHNVDTRAGRNELARAEEILKDLDNAWLEEEFERVSKKYEEQIVFTDDNQLVFDGNQLPKWQEAKRTLEGFLLRNALRQTNNSLTRAARKLGVSKVHVHNLKKKHNI